MDECPHLSASGIDQTPLRDATKIWKCDACGYLYRTFIDGRGIAHDVGLVRCDFEGEDDNMWIHRCALEMGHQGLCNIYGPFKLKVPS